MFAMSECLIKGLYVDVKRTDEKLLMGCPKYRQYKAMNYDKRLRAGED